MATLRHPLVIGSAIVVFVVTLGLNLAFWFLRPASEKPSLSPADVYAKVSPSVVAIDTLRVHPDTERFEELVGSGVVGLSPGTVITNYHVVAHAERIHVTYPSGERRSATLWRHDALADIALLEVSNAPPAVPLQPALQAIPRVGDPVFVIGNPFGLRTSLSAGLISATERYALPDDGPFWIYRPYLQTDAAINHGNSGGPLLDAQGNWIGMATAMVSPGDGSVGVGFCLPITDLVELVQALESGQTPSHGHLGLHVRHDLTLEEGLRISDIWEGSPALDAGIQVNDVLLSMNGRPVHHPRDVYRILKGAQPHHTLQLVVRRGPTKIETEATVVHAATLLHAAGAKP